MATPKGKGGNPGKPDGGMSPGERELVEQAQQSAGIRSDRPRTNDGKSGNGSPGNEPDPRKTGIGVLDAAEEFFQQKQAPQDITVPTERPVGSIGGHRRNPNEDERPPPALKSPEEDEAIIPGDPDDFGARGRRRGTRDAINASPVLRRGLLGV